MYLCCLKPILFLQWRTKIYIFVSSKHHYGMNRRIWFIIVILSALALTSCQPDEQDSPTRDDYTGNWLCSENSKVSGPSSFPITISASSTNTNDVEIGNFYTFGFDSKAKASCSGFNISIPSQDLCNHRISGRGTMNQNKTTINWTYYVNDGQRTDSCTAIFTKK